MVWSEEEHEINAEIAMMHSDMSRAYVHGSKKICNVSMHKRERDQGRRPRSRLLVKRPEQPLEWIKSIMKKHFDSKHIMMGASRWSC